MCGEHPAALNLLHSLSAEENPVDQGAEGTEEQRQNKAQKAKM